MERKKGLGPINLYTDDGWSQDYDSEAFTGVLLLDLDDTLVRTNRIAHLRSERRWGEATRSFSRTSLPPKTRYFLRFAESLLGYGDKFGAKGDHPRVAVVTSSPRFYAEQLLRHHKLELPVVVAYHDTDRHKPDPAPILQAALRLGVSPKTCLYIGDQADDLRAAEAAGAQSIGLNWESPDVFHEPRRVEDTAAQPIAVCTNWNQVRSILAHGRSYYGERYEAGSRFVHRHDVAEEHWPYYDARHGYPLCDGFPTMNPRAALSDTHFDSTWDGDDFSILKYKPLGRGPTAATDLILDYKNNVPGAVDTVSQYAITAIELVEDVMTADQERLSIVGIPSHNPGPCGAHLRSTCEALIDHFDWLDDLIDSLVRTQIVPSAARSRLSERPTPATHHATIVYDGPSDREDSLPPTRNPDAPGTRPSLITGPVIPSIGMQMSSRGRLGRVVSIESSGVVLRLEQSRKVAGKWVNVIQIKWGQEVWARGFSTETVGGLTPKQRSIIMVDDVITTGATSGAARQKLQEAGYGQVFGLFMARTE